MLIRPPLPYPKKRKQIKLRKTKDHTLPFFHYQGKEDFTRKYFTFIVVGETGSGKTTLLDAFVNYLTGVEFKDNWRWKLVDESHLNELSDGKSKTSEISIYYINDHQNKFNLRIIDSPGFGDTSGIETDDLITKKFQKLFSEVPQIDYILLTIKASETRLKHGSKYIYDRIQQLFGIDAIDRFILMCTFADDRTPACLEVVKKQIHFEKHFVFNNSALQTPSDKGTTTTKFYWNMAMESIKIFSDYVIKKSRTPLSLSMSKQVLETRKYIQQSINTSQICLKNALIQLDVAKKKFKNLQQNKQKIQKNGVYKETIQRQVFDRTPLPNTYQMCSSCQVTCCQVCVWPANATQSKCTYFNRGQYCPMCPGKCPKSKHIRANQLITKRKIYQQRIVDLKKKHYQQGLSGVDLYLKQFEEKVIKIQQLIKTVSQRSEQIKKGLRDLQKTALKPKIFTDREYYLQMIQTEEENRQEGWSQRVKGIKSVIQKLESLNKISKSNSLQDLFPGIREFRQQIKLVQSGKKQKIQSNCVIF